MKRRMIALVLAVLVLMLAAMPAMARNGTSVTANGCYESIDGNGQAGNSAEAFYRADSKTTSSRNAQDFQCGI